MVAKLKSSAPPRARACLPSRSGATTIAAGCHHLDGLFDDSNNGPMPESQVPPPASAAPPKNAPPPAPVQPSELPKSVVATWQHDVSIVTPDPLRDGQATPGLVGRVYLFDHFDHPKCYEGKATVKLFDERPIQGGPPVFLEEWDFPSAALRKLAKKDPIGWGYTLFLPTATINPNITQVRMTVAFTADGATVPVQSTNTFRLGQAPVRVYSSQTVPSASYQPAQPQTAYPAPNQSYVPAGYGQTAFGQPSNVASQPPGQYQQSQLASNYPPPYPAQQSVPQNLGTLQLVQQQPMQQQLPAGVQQALAQQPYQANVQQVAVPQRQFVTNPQVAPQQQQFQLAAQQQQFQPNPQPMAQQQLQSTSLLTPPPAPQPFQGSMQQSQGALQQSLNPPAPAALPANFQRSTGY